MLIRSFLDYIRYERNLAERTIEEYGSDIAQFRDFVYVEEGEIELNTVTAEIIREWIVSLMDRGLLSSTINQKLSSLRAFYNYLLRMGKIEKDPLRKITGPKKNKPLPAFVREAEMDKLLDETDFGEGFVGCRDRLIIEMFYVTGMRRAELIGLKDSDIDLTSMQMKVTGKRNKQRIIPFGHELKASIEEYINIRSETLEVMPEAFFVKEDGYQLPKSLVYKVVTENLSKVVTQKKRSPHVLRHTFATTMLNNEAELSAVKELLGHSSLATTEVYTHTTFEELKKVYKQAHPRA